MKWIITAWKARAQQKREPATEVGNETSTEFLPAYLEVVERPAPPWTRRTALAISSLLMPCWFGQSWSTRYSRCSCGTSHRVQSLKGDTAISSGRDCSY